MATVTLGLKENRRQFTILVIVNAFGEGKVDQDRTIFPQIAEHQFGVSSKTAILSFITMFGITKVITNYFMKRMADSLYKLNSKFLAWDEMANLSLPADKTVIFWWRHDKPEQLKMAVEKNYSVVLCPRIPLYFDFVQDSSHTVGRKWKTSYAGLGNLYMFDAGSFLSKSQQNKVLGIQANVWTEVIATTQRPDYMIFPRISALAEAAWSERKNYANYLDRLKTHLPLYEQKGIFYYDIIKPTRFSEPEL